MRRLSLATSAPYTMTPAGSRMLRSLGVAKYLMLGRPVVSPVSAVIASDAV